MKYLKIITTIISILFLFGNQAIAEFTTIDTIDESRESLKTIETTITPKLPTTLSTAPLSGRNLVCSIANVSLNQIIIASIDIIDHNGSVITQYSECGAPTVPNDQLDSMQFCSGFYDGGAAAYCKITFYGNKEDVRANLKVDRVFANGTYIGVATSEAR